MNDTDTLAALLAGLATGLSLIVAIGAQNAFVLRQGLRQEGVGAVVLVCAASDVVLILAGVAGVGALLERAPGLVEVARWAGAAFLVAYGLMAARRAVVGGRLAVDDRGTRRSLWPVVATALALTWLNPHVYLDTVILLGSVAGSYGDARWAFAGGAVVASMAWFAGLGYGARVLRPVFARPAAWRVLDAAVAVVMLAIAARLTFGG
ncbi:amino acid transporter [Mumia sp. ZJ1417]|uniref:LysE/ArgO family amino acid transporter n=1 Tax=Mumia sp. ZJ1417 TaxID=2708082 RepID=UPI0014237CC2|nr:LysE/ArgO family amino acid transporter [Mumia sp. ZJ1417]QMW67535.1 amino acid transporter [Mumia sp. ZJ1417]